MAGAAPATSRSRYDTILKLASGGMATVWVGTVRGALGFRQLVAIKKPHPHLLEDPSFRSEIVTEARLASMIHHANVVDVRDVEIDGDSISLVMDYIEGASLGELIVASSEAGVLLPPRVAVRIAVDALAGLHAAHELVDERGRPVGLVHRDVSPQNIIVGSDGISRVADFGVAKFARKNMASTSDGSLKGKLAYMAPEYLRGEAIDRRFDVFALGVVLWEALSGQRCFRRKNEADTLHALLNHEPDLVSKVVPGLGTAIDAIVACALMKPRDERFQNAAAMAAALESTAGAAQLIAGHVEVAATVKALAGAAIEERRALVRAKLAHEPSVASLLGVPAMGNKPIEVRTTPMMEPMSFDGASPEPSLAPKTEIDMPPTLMVGSVIPSTKPMTPRMEGAPSPPAMRTLPSEPAAVVVVLPPPGIANATHPSAGAAPAPPVAQSAPALGPSPSAPTLGVPADTMDHEGDVLGSGLPPPRRWLAPLLVGIATALIASAIAYGMWRMKSHDPLPASAPPDPASATAPPPSAVPSAVPSSGTAPATSTVPSASPATSTSHQRPAKVVGPLHSSPTATNQASPSRRPPPPPSPYESSSANPRPFVAP